MSDSRQELIENDSSSLLEELTAAYKQGSAIRITAGGLLDALLSPDRKVSTEAATHLHVLGEKLTELILKDSRFPGDCFLMIKGDGIDSKIYPNSIGNLLVHRTLQTGKPEESIQWLQKVLRTKVAFSKRIHSLWGVTVAGEFELTQDVKIVPFEDVPDSEQKHWITSSPSVRSMTPLNSPRSHLCPAAALMMVRRIEPYIYDANKSPYSKDLIKELSDSKELLNDITLVLTVIGPRVAMSLGNWLTFDDEDLQQASTLCGCGWGWQMQEILPDSLTDYPVLDPIEAQQIVQAYLALQGDTKNIVRVALQRLNQALRRSHPGDRAVELSIVLEALLGDRDKRNGITKRIVGRAVNLMGGTDEDRKKNEAIIKKTYDIRSSLVHTGHVEASETRDICGVDMGVSDIIDQATHLCAHLIKKIILDGKIPDWSTFDIAEHKQRIKLSSSVTKSEPILKPKTQSKRL